MILLSITPTDAGLYAAAIVTILGALSAMAVAIINAIKGNAAQINQRLDSAETRREQIGTAIIDPAQTVLPPKEQK